MTAATDAASQLDAVRGLVATGLSVIPLPRPDSRHDGKRPTFPWSDYQQRLPTDAELQAWFGGGPRNLAVITGAVSGVVVVDADSAEAEAWLQAAMPPTPWRVRTARGVHWYYLHPGGRVGNRARVELPGGGTIDIRGDGGYVVGPGSQHATGAVYAPEGDWNAPKAALPPLPLDALPEAPVRAYGAPVAPSPDTPERVLERARAYAAACDPAIEGQGGDNQTFMVCCRIARGFDLSEDQALEVLQDWNRRCRPPWDLGELRMKVRSALRNGDEPLGGRRDEPLPPSAPPVKLGGRVLGTGPGGGLHPDHPDAEKEQVTAAPASGPRPWIEAASDFLAQEDPPEVFLVEELVPEGVLCLVHGDPRARKSWLSLELAVAMVTGTPAFGLERFKVKQAVPVLYSSQEDNRHRVRKRAKRFLRGRGLEEPPLGLYFSVHADINLEDEAWQQTLLRDVKAFGIKAVIFDPIRRYSPNVDKGPAEVRAVTQFLRRLSNEAECTVVIVHHDVKPQREEDTRRRGHRASGGDWFAASEAPIHLEQAGSDASLVVPEDYKFSEDPQPFVFRIVGKAEEPTVRLVAESASAADAKSLVDEEKVLAYLAEHPGVGHNALCKGVRLGRDTLPQVLASLERSGQIDSCPGPRKSTLWFLTSDRERFEAVDGRPAES